MTLLSCIEMTLGALFARSDDQPWSSGSEEPAESPRILWGVMTGSMKIVLLDEHPRRLLIIQSILSQEEVQGNVAIAAKLLELGITDEACQEARARLPAEISEEFPEAIVAHVNRNRTGQLVLFPQGRAASWPLLRSSPRGRSSPSLVVLGPFVLLEAVVFILRSDKNTESIFSLLSHPSQQNHFLSA